MMVLSHSINAECRIFPVLQMREFLKFVLEEVQAPCFCFSVQDVLALSKAGCVYLYMLVKQLVMFILPVAAKGRDKKTYSVRDGQITQRGQ